jgi:L-lactate dehydrogenase (cytochrome)
MMKNSMRTLTMSEVQQHASKDDCWVIIHGKAYDLTAFLPEHPGGTLWWQSRC